MNAYKAKVFTRKILILYALLVGVAVFLAAMITACLMTTDEPTPQTARKCTMILRDGLARDSFDQQWNAWRNGAKINMVEALLSSTLTVEAMMEVMQRKEWRRAFLEAEEMDAERAWQRTRSKGETGTFSYLEQGLENAFMVGYIYRNAEMREGLSFSRTRAAVWYQKNVVEEAERNIREGGEDD